MDKYSIFRIFYILLLEFRLFLDFLIILVLFLDRSFEILIIGGSIVVSLFVFLFIYLLIYFYDDLDDYFRIIIKWENIKNNKVVKIFYALLIVLFFSLSFYLYVKNEVYIFFNNGDIRYSFPYIMTLKDKIPYGFDALKCAILSVIVLFYIVKSRIGYQGPSCLNYVYKLNDMPYIDMNIGALMFMESKEIIENYQKIFSYCKTQADYEKFRKFLSLQNISWELCSKITNENQFSVLHRYFMYQKYLKHDFNYKNEDLYSKWTDFGFLKKIFYKKITPVTSLRSNNASSSNTPDFFIQKEELQKTQEELEEMKLKVIESNLKLVVPNNNLVNRQRGNSINVGLLNNDEDDDEYEEEIEINNLSDLKDL